MTEQMDILLNLADSLTTYKTDFIVAPETFLSNNVWEAEMYMNPMVQRVYQHINKNYKQASFIMGLIYYKLYQNTETKSKTAQEIRGTGTS